MRKKIVLLILVLLFLGTTSAAIFLFSENVQLRSEVIHWSAENRSLSLFLFIAAYVLSCVFLIPGFVLTYLAGAMFGIIKGTMVVSSGVILGAGVVFLLGRYLGRDWVERKIRNDRRFQELDQAIAAESWKLVLLVRLCPVFPFRLCNYLFSVTNITFRSYLIGTWLGTLPSAFTYVYIGALVGALGDFSVVAETSEVKYAKNILLISGAVALLILLFFLGRISKAILFKDRV